MSDQNAAWTRGRDPAVLALKFLSNFEETGQENTETVSVANFIRLAQFGRKEQKSGPDAGLKELKVTWVKKPDKSDFEE